MFDSMTQQQLAAKRARTPLSATFVKRFATWEQLPPDAPELASVLSINVVSATALAEPKEREFDRPSYLVYSFGKVNTTPSSEIYRSVPCSPCSRVHQGRRSAESMTKASARTLASINFKPTCS